ncbi:hypothetical protein OG21DRAFT_1486008 [Imleria badia]|nr:hypothetical protein OG21DRAFT_1486008 [Imleria badia]
MSFVGLRVAAPSSGAGAKDSTPSKGAASPPDSKATTTSPESPPAKGKGGKGSKKK